MIFISYWHTSKVVDCWCNLQILEKYLKNVHIIPDYKHIRKLCLIGIVPDSLLIITNILCSLWKPEMTFEYFICCIFTNYAATVWMFFHSSWIVSFGIITHAFRQLKSRCLYIASKPFPPKVKTDNLNRLRMVHHHSCELLRQLNDVCSYQLLLSFTSFFLNLTFIGFTIVQNAASTTSNNTIEFVVCFMGFTKVIVVFIINDRISQVIHL